MDNLAKHPNVTDNTIVLIVTTEFYAQHSVLLLQRQVAIASKPHPQRPQKPPQTLFLRLALDHLSSQKNVTPNRVVQGNTRTSQVPRLPL